MTNESSGSGWQLDLLDDELATAVVGTGGSAAAARDGEALADELLALLADRGVLSTYGLGADPVDWDGTHKLWRLEEPRELWRVGLPGWDGELFVARGEDDVTLLLPPRTEDGSTTDESLLESEAMLSRSEPYARADSALRDAFHRLDGPELDLGLRDPLIFDGTFRGRPEAALFELDFSVEPLPWRRYLARVLHVYDLQLDFRDRPVEHHDVLSLGHFVAGWLPLPSPDAPLVGQPTIVLLLSADDEQTQQLLPRLRAAAGARGYAVVPAFATVRGSQEQPASDLLIRRLDEATRAAGTYVAGLVVHYGAAFSGSPREYEVALAAFRVRHPDVPLATDALRGDRGGTVEGVGFDQPEKLDFLLAALVG